LPCVSESGQPWAVMQSLVYVTNRVRKKGRRSFEGRPPGFQ
jgi:hypothetical protein